MIHSSRVLSLLFLLALPAAQLYAQVQRGTIPYGSYGGGPDVINLANLNSRITVPVLHKSGRGLNFDFDLYYDTSIWYKGDSGGSTTWLPAGWGWGNSQEENGTLTYSATTTPEFCYTTQGHIREDYNLITYTFWKFVDGSGVAHSFSGESTSDIVPASCPNGGDHSIGLTSTTLDGSGYSVKIKEGSIVTQLWGPDGNIINPLQSVQDRNGNKITETFNGSKYYYDTLSSSTPVLTVAGSGTPASPVTIPTLCLRRCRDLHNAVRFLQYSH